MGLKIWLDDERPTPKDFDQRCSTAAEAIYILSNNKVDFISMDHDLGPAGTGTGYDVAKWIEQRAFYGALKRIGWAVHSQNPVGRKNITSSMENAEKYWRRGEDAALAS